MTTSTVQQGRGLRDPLRGRDERRLPGGLCVQAADLAGAEGCPDGSGRSDGHCECEAAARLRPARRGALPVGPQRGRFPDARNAAAKRLEGREEGVGATQRSLGVGTGGSKHHGREPSNHPSRAIEGDAFSPIPASPAERCQAPCTAQPGEGNGMRRRRPCRFQLHPDGFAHPLCRLAFYFTGLVSTCSPLTAPNCGGVAATNGAGVVASPARPCRTSSTTACGSPSAATMSSSV